MAKVKASTQFCSHRCSNKYKFGTEGNAEWFKLSDEPRDHKVFTIPVSESERTTYDPYTEEKARRYDELRARGLA